jgi:hypothetical protein
MFSDNDKAEIAEWNQEAINQLQEVVDGLLNSTKEANSIEEVRAAWSTKTHERVLKTKRDRISVEHDDVNNQGLGIEPRGHKVYRGSEPQPLEPLTMC